MARERLDAFRTIYNLVVDISARSRIWKGLETFCFLLTASRFISSKYYARCSLQYSHTMCIQKTAREMDIFGGFSSRLYIDNEKTLEKIDFKEQMRQSKILNPNIALIKNTVFIYIYM
jgi:hypothetical protein